ncbi:MAG: hypothetical protein O3A47_13690 [Chloroflexi bacterium]|nr:hypothetical protein [Chloroflexota bacterium]
MTLRRKADVEMDRIGGWHDISTGRGLQIALRQNETQCDIPLARATATPEPRLATQPITIDQATKYEFDHRHAPLLRVKRRESSIAEPEDAGAQIPRRYLVPS